MHGAQNFHKKGKKIQNNKLSTDEKQNNLFAIGFRYRTLRNDFNVWCSFFQVSHTIRDVTFCRMISKHTRCRTHENRNDNNNICPS